jgi:TolB-like protein
MSPEQAVGGAEIDARTDVYALGCVLFEMVSGGLPFEGTGPQAMLAKQVADTAPSLRKTDPQIPVYLDRAVGKAMATDPGQRFATAAEFTDALTTGTIVPKVGAERARRRGLLGGAAAAVLLLVAWGVTAMTGGQRMESLAVLPLTDLTGDPEQEFLSSGVHEALISELGQLGLSVTARATMAKYRDTEKGIAEIAEELGVDGVIEGSVYRGGDSLEIATRLYDRNEQEVWTASFDGVLENVVAMYRGFARAIADEIRLRLDSETEAALDEESPVNPDVYEAYLRGMHLLNNPRSPMDLGAAIQLLETAVEQNPTDARAHAGLALGWATIGHGPAPPPIAWPRAKEAAERAIRLDSTLAEGWQALGDYKSYSERDWDGARRAFERANELNPSLSMNHYHYAWWLVMFGHVEEAVREHELAKQLDPLTPLHTVWLPALYWFSQDYDTALEEALAVVAQIPNGGVANYVLGETYARLGRWDEAIAAQEKMVAAFPPFVMFLGYTYLRAGRMDEGLTILEQLESQPPSPFNALGLAIMYAALGNREEALTWLEYEPEHAWTPGFASAMSSDFDGYRDDPRYQAVLRRWNLRIEPGDLVPTALPPLPADSAGAEVEAAD